MGSGASISRSSTSRARLRAAGADAPVIEIGGGLWIRLSAQAYNRLDDYVRLGDLIDALQD